MDAERPRIKTEEPIKPDQITETSMRRPEPADQVPAGPLREEPSPDSSSARSPDPDQPSAEAAPPEAFDEINTEDPYGEISVREGGAVAAEADSEG